MEDQVKKNLLHDIGSSISNSLLNHDTLTIDEVREYIDNELKDHEKLGRRLVPKNKE